MKPRVKKIPREGLAIWVPHAHPGELVQLWPIFPCDKGLPRFGFISELKRNKYGRVSYRLTDGRNIMTENLTPYHHSGVIYKTVLGPNAVRKSK